MLTQIPEGTVILREGEINMDMYKIISGHAEVYTGYETDAETVLGIISKDAYFGELGLLTQKPAIYTVVAYSDLVVNRITQDEIDDYMSHNHHDMFAVLANMANTMYNLKYNYDLLLKELSLREEDKKRYEEMSLLSRQLLRFHAQGMDVAKRAFDKKV